MDENLNLSNSILSSVKKLIGINEEDTSFDVDIIFNINAAFGILYQLGVIKKPFVIYSKENTYNDVFPKETEDVISQVKMYLFYKTKLGFDTSGLTANVIQTIKEQISELEWRLMVSFNPDDTFKS